MNKSQRIERARSMVQQALGKNLWLNSEGARIIPQGSFTNRTNTRLDADIDLRVQHPTIKIEYAHGVDVATAYQQGGYYGTGFSYAYTAAKPLPAKLLLRKEHSISSLLSGVQNVTAGQSCSARQSSRLLADGIGTMIS